MTLKEAIAKYTLEKCLTGKMKERNITNDNICDYIVSYAKEKLNSKDGAISDEEIYGQVVHFIEDAYKGEKTKPQPDVKVVAATNTEQLSLFDFMEGK